jgi:hypothetical protein
MRRALVLLVAVAALSGCGSTKTVTVTNTVTHVRTVTAPPKPATTTTAKPVARVCAADSLRGSFAVVEGSAGAGHIVYRLTLTNSGSSPCFVSGIPQVQLLGTTGGALPTTVAAAQPGTATAVKVTLHAGGSAHADARFSPDVNGVGDNAPGQCQPTATVLQVTAPGGGTLDAPVQPPTPVCERGSLEFSVYSH